MPTPETHERFILRVGQNAHVEAVHEVCAGQQCFHDPAQRLPARYQPCRA